MNAHGPHWHFCVITFPGPRYSYSVLNNALLYADEVKWVPLELVLLQVIVKVRQTFAPIQIRARDALIDPYKFDVDGMKKTVVDMAEEVSRSDLANNVDVVTVGRFGLDMFDDPDQANEVFYPIAVALSRCRVVLQNQPRLLHADVPTVWNAYSAAGHLMQAMSDLLLPDVSSLPLEVVAEMRDRLKDSLDPMRAEMLRFTDQLRAIIGDKPPTPEILATEARNLIATRVEPVVREASHRTRQLAEKKWRKLYTSAAKAFGFAGAALIDPKLIAKAIQQTLELGAVAFGGTQDDCPPAMGRASAQFVLAAHTVPVSVSGS